MTRVDPVFATNAFELGPGCFLFAIFLFVTCALATFFVVILIVILVIILVVIFAIVFTYRGPLIAIFIALFDCNSILLFALVDLGIASCGIVSAAFFAGFELIVAVIDICGVVRTLDQCKGDVFTLRIHGKVLVEETIASPSPADILGRLPADTNASPFFMALSSAFFQTQRGNCGFPNVILIVAANSVLFVVKQKSLAVRQRATSLICSRGVTGLSRYRSR